jgi:hypothetical protein
MTIGPKFNTKYYTETLNALKNNIDNPKIVSSSEDLSLIQWDLNQIISDFYEVEGDLTLHGVTKKVKTKITLLLAGGKVNANCNFTVHAQDYKIDIPSLVKEKFAENIKVNFTAELQSK